MRPYNPNEIPVEIEWLGGSDRSLIVLFPPMAAYVVISQARACPGFLGRRRGRQNEWQAWLKYPNL